MIKIKRKKNKLVILCHVKHTEVERIIFIILNLPIKINIMGLEKNRYKNVKHKYSSLKINWNEKANRISHLRFFTTWFWKELTASQQQYQLVRGFTVRYRFFDSGSGLDFVFRSRIEFSILILVLGFFTFSKRFQHQLWFVSWFDHDSILVYVLIKTNIWYK